jgi:DNA-binding XRE family transcriptional regulator
VFSKISESPCKLLPISGSFTSLLVLIFGQATYTDGGGVKLDRDKLIRAREMLGYGIETVAAEAGVSKNSVLRAEHEDDIRPLTARKIAAALGVRVADLIGESETLKAQPRLPDFNGESRTYDYTPVRDALDEFCACWEKRLADGDLDKTVIEEVGDAAMAFTPALEAALNAEIRELQAKHGGAAGYLAGQTVLWPAIDRFMVLSRNINYAYRTKFGEGEEADTAPMGKLYQFERFANRRAHQTRDQTMETRHGAGA